MNQKNPKDTQNFITSKKHVKEILNHTNISKQDNVIEIGSGKGHFTKELYMVIFLITSVRILSKELPLKVRLNIAILSLRRDLRKDCKICNELWVYY